MHYQNFLNVAKLEKHLSRSLRLSEDSKRLLFEDPDSELPDVPESYDDVVTGLVVTLFGLLSWEDRQKAKQQLRPEQLTLLRILFDGEPNW
jgi:hypothetical protein